MSITYKGVSFPFKIGADGGVAESSLSNEETDRIQQSVTQILLTRKGERMYRPEFGTRVHEVLFEDIDSINTMGLIKFYVEEDLREQEERIELTDVYVGKHPEIEGAIITRVEYIITQFGIVDEVVVTYNKLDS